MTELILPIAFLAVVLLFIFVIGNGKITLIGVTISFFIFVLWGSQLMGVPRLEKFHLPEEEVFLIAHVIEEEEAIYLWLATEGAPLSLELPYSAETARELQELEEAMREGERASIVYRGSNANDEDDEFGILTEERSMRK